MGSFSGTTISKHVKRQISSLGDFNVLHGAGTRANLAEHAQLDKYFNYRVGKPYIVSTYYESLDYDTIESELRVEEEQRMGFRYLRRKNLMKWFAFLQIGFFTALVASMNDVLINSLNRKKYDVLHSYMTTYERHDIHIVLIVWILINVVPFTFGLLLVTYIEPMAAGSGIPLVKCYLNGINVPRILSFKSLIIKALGLSASIIGGVASGKEGPMIHVGACVANLVAAGQLNICGARCSYYMYFRDDKERRDLVSAGAAAGVSAAFGAPVGGVLFSLEEGASFWNQTLTWRIFLSSIVSKMSINFILSYYYGLYGDLQHPSLVNMGSVDFQYSIYEMPLFALMGIMGGIMGSIWNMLNTKLAEFRLKFLRQSWTRVLEGMLVAALHAIVAFTMTYFIGECSSREPDNDYPVRTLCDPKNKNAFNVVGTMWLATPQKSVNALLHDPNGTYTLLSLATFTIAYYSMSCLTFGLSSSNGIFVPTILSGASWGRLVARLATKVLPKSIGDQVDSRKYALIGGCAQLGGVTRMTICLTVLLMEASDNISFCIPIIVTVFCAKWVGDFFGGGIYDIQIALKACPFLPPEPPPLAHSILANEMMRTPVICLKSVENVGYIMSILSMCSHNGFPVVDATPETADFNAFTGYADRRKGQIRGMILRSQILILLAEKYYYEKASTWRSKVTLDTFRSWYLEKLDFEDLVISQMEKDYHLDLRPFMNHSPYTLLPDSSLPRIFILFRALGLRHLPIVNETNNVIGIITRKDLCYFKVVTRFGKLYKCEFILV